MIALFLSPVYIALNVYILWWILKWMGECHGLLRKKSFKIAMSVIYSAFAFSMVIGFFMPPTGIGRLVRMTGNYWLGIMLYMLLSIAVLHLLGFVIKKIPQTKKYVNRKSFVIYGAVCAVLIIVTGAYGVINAHNIKTNRYEITVEKGSARINELNVVLIADLHMGYNIGRRSMRDMANLINAENPDAVVIAGDIFDNEYKALDNPDELAEIFRGIKTKYGIYACYGNHDVAERLLAGFTFSGDAKKQSDVRMDEWLKSAGITLLRDEYVLIDDSFYIYGRPDYQKPGRGIDKRKTPQEVTENLDKSKPIIVIDHQPRELGELADVGVDVDLCGHTHDGQVFPGNLTIKLMWENACGYLKKGNMHNIVTSGVGLFGPNMRVGTDAEICPIHIVFK